MSASRRVVSALFPLVVALLFVLSTGARAGDPATIRPVDSKTRPVPAKSAGPILKIRKGTAVTDGQLLSALKQQIWLAQHKGTVHQVRQHPIPSSKPAPPLSRNAQREAIRQSLQGFSRLQRYGVQAPARVRGKIPGFNPFTPSKPAGINSGGVVPVLPAATENVPSGVQGHGSSALFLVIVAVAIAFAGTASVLYMISRRPTRMHETHQPLPAAREQHQALRPVLAQAGEKPVDHVEPVPGDLSAEEEGVMELAQRFRRGQGEMQLVVDLQTRKEADRGEIPLISSSLRRQEGTKRDKRARRPAFGKGEMDLLSRLRKYQSSASNAQRML